MNELEERTTYSPEVLEAARREEERRLVREGTELWRARKEEALRQKQREQSELRRMLANYWPWGRPGGGAPCVSALRKKNLPLEPAPFPQVTNARFAGDHHPFQSGYYYPCKYKIFSDNVDCCYSASDLCGGRSQQHRQLQPHRGNGDRSGIYRLAAERRNSGSSLRLPAPRHVPDATRHGYEIDSLRSSPRHASRKYIADLAEQMRQKQYRAMEERRDERESNRRHFDTWRRLWGRPGHGAPLDRALRRSNLHDILYRTTSGVGIGVVAATAY